MQAIAAAHSRSRSKSKSRSPSRSPSRSRSRSPSPPPSHDAAVKGENTGAIEEPQEAEDKVSEDEGDNRGVR